MLTSLSLAITLFIVILLAKPNNLYTMFIIVIICQVCFLFGVNFITAEMELEIKELKNKIK